MAVTQRVRHSILVEKETIASYNFPNSDVLIDIEEKKQRKRDLNLAVQLGNIFKQKVRIFFSDDQSAKCVETTVWMVSENYISLKNGTIIPVQRIKSVSLF